MTYVEKLKHPKWQKKRLEILERDDFTCQDCGRTDKTLHVHHFYYERNKMPWEYPCEHLITLCAPCHELVEESMLIVQKEIAGAGVKILHGLTNYDFIQSTREYCEDERKQTLQWLKKTSK